MRNPNNNGNIVGNIIFLGLPSLERETQNILNECFISLKIEELFLNTHKYMSKFTSYTIQKHYYVQGAHTY